MFVTWSALAPRPNFTPYDPFQVDFSDPRWKDVNVVSSLLKMFLRKLPEPLLTDKLYPFFIDANRITGHAPRLKKLRHLVSVRCARRLVVASNCICAGAKAAPTALRDAQVLDHSLTTRRCAQRCK